MGFKANTKNNILEQPKALYVLFFVELWERFSYYGVRALIIFYMTSQLGFDDISAYGAYGMYFALVSAATVAGGYLADHYLGDRPAIYIGGIFIALGHLFLLLFSETDLFNYGLAFIVVGSGFFKANVTSLLGQYYHPNDPRRDSGFTIFYMGINIGAFLAPFICGYFGRQYGWHYGFGLSGLGILLGLLILFFKNNVLEDKGESPDNAFLYTPRFLGLSPYHKIILGALCSVPVFAWCIEHHALMGNFLHLFGIITLFFLARLALKCQGEERKSMLTLLLMIPFFIIFWASYEQVGASLNLFIDRHVNREFMGYTIETTWFLSLTPFFIITVGPAFAFLWIFLSKRKLEPMTPLKFAVALFQISLSFWFLQLGISYQSAPHTISMGWVLLAYFFRTTGELCLSPIALSMVTKLAPPHLTSFMMGTFFLSIAFAQIIAQQIAKYFTLASFNVTGARTLTDQAISLNIFSQIFECLMYLPLIAGLVLLIVSPLLKDIFRRHQ